MTRTLAIISCLVAALLLFPIQNEFSEVPEYEAEAEIECCTVVNACLQSKVLENQEERKTDPLRRIPERMTVSYPRSKAVGLPARILHCVFRE